MPTGIYERKLGKSLKHGFAPRDGKTAIYRCWTNMKSRCNNPTADSYYLYGGRGITYCAKWETFTGFYEDMGTTYREGLTIERIDSNKNYSKENCRWATVKEQANNTSRNHRINYAGTSHTLAEWSDITGLNSSTIRMRLSKHMWSIPRALGYEEGHHSS